MKENYQNNLLNIAALNVKRSLSKNGFSLSRTNPFHDWVRGEQPTFCSPEELAYRSILPIRPFPKLCLMI